MTAANSSFYQVGGTLPGDSPAYVTRQADADLYAGLQASQFCYVLNSRQMGKSSLRVRVMQRLQAEGVACAAIDITAIGSQSPNLEQWYAGVARQILAGLGLTGQLPLRSWWKEREYLPPVDRLGALIEWLLGALPGKIAIFVDEIDSVLSLQFPIDDFFAFIRACYNLRVDRPEYERITFALFGVATPGELIRDKTRTPFNIGRAIEVEGFTAGEVAPLAAGLGPRGSEILAEILEWTGGQPFLTQRVCRLVAAEIPPSPPNSYGEATPTKGGDRSEGSEVPLLKGDLGGSGDLEGSIARLVQSQVIDRWEANDEQTHLRTIRDRVLERPEQERREILGIYQRVLAAGSVRAEDSAEQMALRLSGLVVKRDGRLWSYNRIYRSVFDGAWIEGELARLCPFAEQMMAWMRDRDDSRLLRGQALREGREWGMAQVRLRSEEVGFIQASLDLERQEERAAAQVALAAQEEANRILQAATAEAEGKLAVAEEEAERKVAAATRKANRRNAVSLVGAALALTVAAIAVPSSIKAGFDRDRAQKEVQTSQQEKGQLETEKSTLEQRLKSIQQKEKQAQQKVTLAQKQFQQAQQNLATAKRNVEAANQQMQGALAAAQAAQQKEQQANQQLAGANQKIAAADQKLQTAQQQATKAQQQATAAATVANKAEQKTELANQMLQAVGIQVDAAKAQAVRLAGQQLLGLVQGIRAAGKYQQLSTKLKGTDKQPTPEWMEAKLQTQAVLTNVYGIQERNSLKSNQGIVRSVNFSPDGQTIVSGGDDGTVKLWNLDGSERATLQGHQGWVSSVNFSPNGQTIVSGGYDGTVKLWNLDGSERATLQGNQGIVLSVNFSPDGQTIVSGGDDGTMKLWNLDGSERATLKGNQGIVLSVNFSPDGQTIVSGGSDGTVKLWNLDGSERATLQGNQGIVLSVNFSPDGQTIVSGGQDGTLKLAAWGLEPLLKLSCDWARDYLRTNPDVSDEDRAICGLPPSKAQ